MTAQKLYRLHVTYPEGSDKPGWEPEGWDAWEVDGETGAPEIAPFYWPSNRPYRSKGGAEGRAWLFMKYGATVTIEESEPVIWTGVEKPVRQNPRPATAPAVEPVSEDTPF